MAKSQYWVFVWVLKLSELRNRTGPAQLDLGVISKECNYKKLEIGPRSSCAGPVLFRSSKSFSTHTKAQYWNFFVQVLDCPRLACGAPDGSTRKCEQTHRVYFSKTLFPFSSLILNLPNSMFTKNERGASLPNFNSGLGEILKIFQTVHYAGLRRGEKAKKLSRM